MCICDCVIALSDGLKRASLSPTEDKDNQEQIFYRIWIAVDRTYFKIVGLNTQISVPKLVIQFSISLRDFRMASFKILVTGATGYM